MKTFITFIKNLTFKKKLFSTYIVISLFPLIILGVFSYNISRESVINQSSLTLQNSINTIAESIHSKKESFNLIANSIAYNSKIQRILHGKQFDLLYLSQNLEDYFAPLIYNIEFMHEEIERITLYTATDMHEYGQEIQSFNKIKNETWVQVLLANQKQDWFFHEGKLFIAQPLSDFYSNTFIGILYMEISKEKFIDRSIKFELEQYLVFLEDNHKHILYSDNNINELQQVNKMDALAKKNNYLKVQSEIPDGWSITCYVPQNIFTQNILGIIRTTVMMVSICFIIVITLTTILSMTISKPINQLNKKIKLVKKGNLDLVIKSPYNDEIGQLTNNFGNMIERINLLILDGYKKEITQKKAELKALQAQINPHFLYNTLSVMKWKAMDIEANELSDMISLLSTFYRTSLNKGESITTIKDELDNTKSYIEIQNMIHENTFRVYYDIDETICSYNILNLILQPLVENALEHGLFKKKDGEKKLFIIAHQSEDKKNIMITIKDTGIGLKSTNCKEILNKKSKGYGLRNVNQRIKLFYGEQYGLKIKSEYLIGTQVIVHIPKYTAPS